jgi:hypothetical protein
MFLKLILLITLKGIAGKQNVDKIIPGRRGDSSLNLQCLNKTGVRQSHTLQPPQVEYNLQQSKFYAEG